MKKYVTLTTEARVKTALPTVYGICTDLFISFCILVTEEACKNYAMKDFPVSVKGQNKKL